VAVSQYVANFLVGMARMSEHAFSTKEGTQRLKTHQYAAPQGASIAAPAAPQGASIRSASRRIDTQRVKTKQ
jgi:hypothetical protein